MNISNTERLTCTAHGTETVLIESKTLIYCHLSHIFIEDIGASEIQQGTVVLVMGDKSEILKKGSFRLNQKAVIYGQKSQSVYIKTNL